MSDDIGDIGETDERDPALAAALAVEPLDTPTRQRLVGAALAEVDADVDADGVAAATALQAADGDDARRDDGDDAEGDAASDVDQWRRPGRLAAALGLAAALVIGAVVGALIVTQPDDEGTRTAASAPTTQAAKAASPAPGGATDSAAESDAGAAPQAAAGPAVALGDLGSVRDAAALRAAVNSRLEAGASSTPASVPCLPSTGGTGVLGLVSITAAGTATLADRPVVVLVGPTTGGSSVAALVDAARGCEFVRFVNL